MELEKTIFDHKSEVKIEVEEDLESHQEKSPGEIVTGSNLKRKLDDKQGSA